MTAHFTQKARALDDSAPGPLLTSDDYEKIKDYVSYGLDLPVVIQAVEVFVGYKTAGAAGLEPSDLRTLFAQIRDNAAQWEDISDRVARQAATLSSIAYRVIPSGESLLDGIRAMPLYVKVRSSIGKDPLELPAIDVPDETFGAADAEKKRSLMQQLEGLRKVNLERIDDTAVPMAGIAAFRRGIETLEPIVSNKRAALKKSNLEKIGQETTVEPMIESLQREYDRAVQTSGPAGAIASAKRRELDQAIGMLKSQMDVYRGRQRVTYTMGRLFVHFTELGLVMVDAETAVGHLWTSWQETSAALENSAAGFGTIDSSRKLIAFLSDFQTIMTNWKIVQKRAVELARLF